MSTIIPLPKGKEISLNNLRPISLLSSLSKIFEKCLLFYLKKDIYKLYDNNQFGFRPKSSTQCAFIALHSKILKSLDQSPPLHTFVINFDLAKAFDTINHDILISTLSSCNLPLCFIKLTNSYLRDRSQLVLVDSIYSSKRPIYSGIPQGSVHGPILFCLYIRSLQPSNTMSQYYKFADDTTFVVSVPIKEDYCEIITQEVNHVENWCSINKMRLNNSKTKIMLISSSLRRNQLLFSTDLNQFVTENIVFLGYNISNNLNWSLHVKSLIKKISSRLQLIRMLKNSLTKAQLINVYFAYIQSLIDYLFPIVYNLTLKDINTVNSLIKRSHGIICGWTCTQDCLPDFHQRCKILSINLFKKAMNDCDHTLHPLLPHKSIRSNRLIIPYTHSDKHLQSFFPQCAIAYNKELQCKS